MNDLDDLSCPVSIYSINQIICIRPKLISKEIIFDTLMQGLVSRDISFACSLDIHTDCEYYYGGACENKMYIISVFKDYWV